MRYLIDKHGLDKQPRENVPVYIEDMVPFNETILQTREKRFHLGFQRVLEKNKSGLTSFVFRTHYIRRPIIA